MTKIKLLRAPSIAAKFRRQVILSTFFCLALPGSWHVVIGQNVDRTPEPRSVARLISMGEGTDHSRARRISREESAYEKISAAVAVPTVDEVSLIERRAFTAINGVRIKHELPLLSWDQDLYWMARAHSRQMAVNGFFSHQTPQGLGLRDRARTSGIRAFKVLAENIAYNQGCDDPGAFAVERWMVSSEHRANILSNEFRATAIGSFIGPDQKVYLTQVFIAR